MRRSRRRRLRSTAAECVPQGHASQDRWLISYADFMTLLFAVFVVLFAYSWHSKQELHTVSTAIHSGFETLGASLSEKNGVVEGPTTKAPATPEKVRAADPAAELRRQLQDVLGDSINKHEVVMQQTSEGLVISLRELGFFDSGDAKLLPGAAEKLHHIAGVLMQHGLEVRVEGHSDDQPIHNAVYGSNWELSTARAMSVLTMLVDDAGFPATKISVAGYGPYRPVASNETAEGRRTNRRVDLVVLTPRAEPSH